MKTNKGRKKVQRAAQQLQLLEYPLTASSSGNNRYAPGHAGNRRPLTPEKESSKMSGGEDTAETPDNYYVTPEELMGFWGPDVSRRGRR
jgi:hypothetical protein